MELNASYVCEMGGLYRIAGIIGGELYLADWRFSCHTANIKSTNVAPMPEEGMAIVP